MQTATRTKKIIINANGKPVTMFRQNLPGIFAGVESWISQGSLDMVERARIQEAWKRKEQRNKRKLKPY